MSKKNENVKGKRGAGRERTGGVGKWREGEWERGEHLGRESRVGREMGRQEELERRKKRGEKRMEGRKNRRKDQGRKEQAKLSSTLTEKINLLLEA